MMTAYVAKRLSRLTKSDKAAHALVSDYAARYMANRGLVASFPRLCVGMMPELSGWPVRNADGGANVAHFSSYEAARTSLVACEQSLRTA